MSKDLIPLPASQCPSGCRSVVVRRGYFRRKCDQQKVQRFLCRGCGKSFSVATTSFFFRQKKRHLGPVIFKLLVGGFSQRRTALDLRVNRKTVVRKFIALGSLARELFMHVNRMQEPVTDMEFDDLETFEHTKCKPLSVTMAVEHGSRRILGFRVAKMPAKGKLAAIAREKYGPREDQRSEARRELLEELKELIASGAKIKSDQNPHYTADVATHFPDCEHLAFKGRRGCVVGQGELKRGGFDPLFSLNHTFAMLRANINRLFRRTWCTTKRPDRLELHIALYVLRHNLHLIHSGRSR